MFVEFGTVIPLFEHLYVTVYRMYAQSDKFHNSKFCFDPIRLELACIAGILVNYSFISVYPFVVSFLLLTQTWDVTWFSSLFTSFLPLHPNSMYF